MHEPTVRVGYVLKMFPRLSETFILNELLALEEQGADLSVFSLMYPADGKFHGRLGRLACTADYLPRDKLEGYWERIHAADLGLVPGFDRWEAATRFLRRHRIPKDLDLLLRSVAIAVEVRRRRIQHLHAHFATIATRVAAVVHLLTGVPFSFTSHAKDIFRSTVDFGLYQELLELAAFNVTVSDFNRRHLAERIDARLMDKVVRLYNGIDLSYFAPVEDDRRVDQLDIVSVGRLVPKKGFGDLLAALALLHEKNVPARLTIIGDGEGEADLRARSEAAGLTGVVEFAGALSQEETRDRVAGATMMALACCADADGNMDALPTVLLEALALDVPLVSTRLSGVPEIVAANVGELAEAGNPASMAEAIERLWQRIQRGDVARGTCRERAAELFDLRANAGRLFERFRGSAAEVAAP